MIRLVPVVSVVLALSALLVAGPSGDGPSPAHPDTLLVDTLDNGLQVVIEERPGVPVARVLAFMRIGALYEGEYLGCGLSHYMEHIVAGGSTRREVTLPDGTTEWVGRTEVENKALLKSIGGNSNAKTSYDYTQYFITTKSEMVETAVDLIANYLQHCQFDPVEVAREQGVVQQELLRNLDDANRTRAVLFTETMFQEHPVRVPVIGYRDCIQRVTREDMLRFYNRHYTPQNCVVAIVGDVDRHEMMELVKRHFGGWKRKPLEPYQIPQEPPQTGPRWVEEEHGSTQTCLVAMGVPTIPLRHPDLYALDMLSNVLGLGAASRLPRKFEHDPSRPVHATQIGTSSYTPDYGAGRFACFFSAETAEQSRALVEEVWSEMERMKEDLVEPAEIERALKVLEKYYHLGRATVDDRAEELAHNLATLGDPLFNDRYLDRIRAVTPEQIREAARRYLLKDRRSVVIVTPPRPASAREESAAAEAEQPVREIDLDNGLKVLLRRVPGYGMVDIAMCFHGGVLYETEETNGLFFLMANSFWRGTKQRPFPVLMQAMDQLGMDFSSESHNNVYQFTGRCLGSDLEPALGIVREIVREPAIEPMWVERVKQILLAQVLPNLEVQADAMMDGIIRSTLYEKSPYRMQRYGTPESVSTFDAVRVRQLYETFTRPNNCVLALYGDLDPEAAEKLVRAAFGDWEKGTIPESGVCPEPPLPETITVERTNRQVRTNLRLAWRAFSRQEEEDCLAMSVMSTIIGAQGWLHSRLREGDNEYVYSVYTRPYQGDGAGHYFIDTDIDPKDEAEVLAIIQGVVDDVCAGRFTDEELALAKKMILCYDALGKMEYADVCRGDAMSELYGRGWDYDQEFYAGIRAVRREDVVRVANAIFGKPGLRIFVRPEPDSKQGN